MKNPFADTSKYAVVREYNRIVTKSRSISDSSGSSDWSNQCSSRQDTASRHWEPVKRNRIEKEYFGKKAAQSNIRQIQQRGARLYGVQQLRYKPHYFKEIQENSIPRISEKEVSEKSCTQQNYYLEIKKPSIKPARREKKLNDFKSQKSIKSQRFVNMAQLDRIHEQDEVIQKSECDSQQRSQSRRRSRCSSVMESLINVGCNQLKNSSQVYCSIADLKSNKYLLRMPGRDLKKKSSLFFTEIEQASKTFDNDDIVQPISSDSSLDQSNQNQSSMRFAGSIRCLSGVSVKRKKKNIFPSSLLIRHKMYYQYQRPKK